jgi:FKBP-type peptidyl-prolyl cis-trans isomerase FkpA
MKNTTVLLGLLMLLCVACNKSEKETPSGLKFSVIKAGDGKLPKPGELVVFNYLMKDSNDSIWTNTLSEDYLTAMPIADSTQLQFENGLNQLLRMVSKGDSISTSMSIKDFFKKIMNIPVPTGLDTALTLSFHFKIDAIMNREQFMAAQNEKMNKWNSEQLQKELKIIDDYIEQKGIDANKSETGIRYLITKNGTGDLLQPGQTALVNYAGYLLDGNFFDTNIKKLAEENGIYNLMREPYNPFEVTIDQTPVIKGWHEALKLLSNGAKGTFYIPSTLAYGRQQKNDLIKPNTILIFDIEVLAVK